MTDTQKPVSRQTAVTVTVGGLLFLGGGAAGVGRWMGKDEAWKEAIEASVQANGAAVVELKTMVENSLAESNVDRWKGRDMTRWVLEFAERNPDLDVPTPFTHE